MNEILTLEQDFERYKSLFLDRLKKFNFGFVEIATPLTVIQIVKNFPGLLNCNFGIDDLEALLCKVTPPSGALVYASDPSHPLQKHLSRTQQPTTRGGGFWHKDSDSSLWFTFDELNLATPDIHLTLQLGGQRSSLEHIDLKKDNISFHPFMWPWIYKSGLEKMGPATTEEELTWWVEHHPMAARAAVAYLKEYGDFGSVSETEPWRRFSTNTLVICEQENARFRKGGDGEPMEQLTQIANLVNQAQYPG